MADNYTSVPLTPMRKVIAARMSEAKQTIPHFRLAADIEMDTLIELRKQLRRDASDGELSLNDLLVKACATALMDVPAVNIQWVDGEIRQFHHADVSVVMAVEGGLAAPIIRGADSKSVWEIAREMRSLGERASRNALKMSEILGGSFSISNLGMHGVDQFDAIINPPQCAILAVGSAKPRVLVSDEAQTRIATVLRATLSIDHRALDGVKAAEFLTALRQRIERPDYLSSAQRLIA